MTGLTLSANLPQASRIPDKRFLQEPFFVTKLSTFDQLETSPESCFSRAAPRCCIEFLRDLAATVLMDRI